MAETRKLISRFHEGTIITVTLFETKVQYLHYGGNPLKFQRGGAYIINSIAKALQAPFDFQLYNMEYRIFIVYIGITV